MDSLAGWQGEACTILGPYRDSTVQLCGVHLEARHVIGIDHIPHE